MLRRWKFLSLPAASHFPTPFSSSQKSGEVLIEPEREACLNVFYPKFWDPSSLPPLENWRRKKWDKASCCWTNTGSYDAWSPNVKVLLAELTTTTTFNSVAVFDICLPKWFSKPTTTRKLSGFEFGPHQDSFTKSISSAPSEQNITFRTFSQRDQFNYLWGIPIQVRLTARLSEEN